MRFFSGIVPMPSQRTLTIEGSMNVQLTSYEVLFDWFGFK